MTLFELERILAEGNIPEYKNEVLLFFEKYTGISAAFLIADKSVSVGGRDEEKLLKDIEERLSGRPVQYILGSCSFMGLDFEVNESVLVPRQETELLVDLAVKKLPENAFFADLCTGSGCIAVSVVKMRPDVSCIAADKYPDALGTAERNAEKNRAGGKISFVLSDVTKDPPDETRKMRFDAVLANPPYISKEEYETLDITVKREPRHALTDEADGLFIAKKILENYTPLIKKGGFLAMEIGYRQGADIKKAGREYNLDIEVLKDYSKNDRIAFCRIDK